MKLSVAEPIRPVASALLVCLGLCSAGTTAIAAEDEGKNSTAELSGLWTASRHFGPRMRGTLELVRQRDVWRAEIAGYSIEAGFLDGRLEFEIPGDRGRFLGRLEAGSGRIVGHWIQPRTRTSGQRFASPVELEASGENRWSGEVVPLDDGFTFYLALKPRDNGSLGAFFRNPERNLGVFLNLDRLERDGDRIELFGSWLRNKDERLLSEGTYRPNFGHLSLYIPRGQGTYDFERVDADPTSGFYARGKNPGAYEYRPPTAHDDGWAVGTLAEAGIATEPIKRLIETEITPSASLHDVYVHAMLIARHGKLVLEEYFHGFDRLTPHDTRSASKSATATLIGAAIQAGAPIGLSTPVYEAILGDSLESGLDPRKRRVTVEHLLTMASGFHCDDSDPSSPGAEDVMQQQTTQPDWYRYTLALDLAREPGGTAVYCSANPNLLGAVLAHATGEQLPALFHRLIAEPLDLGHYHLNLQPTGEPYMGGGIHWLPRDFMKLGQLYLDRGFWNGKRILSTEFAARATEPLYDLRERGYGYLWWVIDYPYKDRSVRAFFAGGNGGQVVIGIPDLDLVVAFFAGNYNDRVLFRMQDEFVPQFILPAIDEQTGDRQDR